MTELTCWCGNPELEGFGQAYRICRSCGTLVGEDRPIGDPQKIQSELLDYYGRKYWFEHQARLGNPDIERRARADLPERCSVWLASLLKYKLPPGRLLEVGCAHGAFVALSVWSGFSSVGLELSSWVVEFARRSFGIPVLEGSVEDLELEPQSYDAIVMMDVLEHLPDPARTIARCRRLLKDDGVLLIQTPCFPEGGSLAELEETGSDFLKMLIPREHIFLFSLRSVEQLCHESGLNHVTFEPALFSYDMFLSASPAEPVRNSRQSIEESLQRNPRGRLVLALLDSGKRLCS